MRTRFYHALSVILLLPLHAAAQEGEPREPERRTDALPRVDPDSPSGVFGARRQLAISSDAGLSIGNTSIADVDGSTTQLVVRPAIDYFLIDNLSLGGFLGLDYTKTPGGSSTAFSIGPRVGYNLPFSERFSVWPKVGFSFSSTSVDQEGVEIGGVTTDDTSETNTALALNLFVPLMFHPVDHFFLGFGPALDTDLSGDAKATTIAGRLTIGGWL